MAHEIDTFKDPANSNHDMIDYPTQVTRQLSDAEQFLIVFNKLVKDKVAFVDAFGLGIATIYFNDGTSIGGMVPWYQSGVAMDNAIRKIRNSEQR